MPRTIWSGAISFGLVTSLNQSHLVCADARRTMAKVLNARQALRRAGDAGLRQLTPTRYVDVRRRAYANIPATRWTAGRCRPIDCHKSESSGDAILGHP
ncbi:hypothetical protein ACFQ7G_24755 [Streptomyces massasporeus]